MKSRDGVILLTAMAVAVVVAGCTPCPPETVSREELFAQYNGNAEKVPALWAIADIEIELADQLVFRKVRLTDGRLYFRRGPHGPDGPHFFLLRGREVGQTFFQLGIDAQTGQFYYWVMPPGAESFARWGRLADLSSGGAESMTIDPTQLLSVLGVTPWPTDLDGPTQVILKTLDKPCVYAMSVVARRPEWGGWYLQREQWLCRRTTPPRTKNVRLFNRQGQSVMEAEIDRHQPVDGSADEQGEASMPTDIMIRWPKAEGIRAIRIRLTGQTVGDEDNPVPGPAAFRRRIPSEIRDARPLDARPGPRFD